MDTVLRSFKDSALEDTSCNVVIIRDSVEVLGGPQVFRYQLQELHKAVESGRSQARGLILLALERPPEDYQGTASSLQILDCFSDPLHWGVPPVQEATGHIPKTSNVSAEKVEHTLKTYRFRSEAESSKEEDNSGEASSTSQESKAMGGPRRTPLVHFGRNGSLEDLKGSIQAVGELLLKDASSGRLALVLDSVSSLLQYCSSSKVLAFLEWLRWSGRISTILMLLHADLHDATTNAAFERLASSVFDVQAPPLLDDRGSADGRILVRHKTRKGKVRHEREQFWLETSGVRFGAIERTASVSALVAKESTSMQSGRALPPTRVAASPEVSFNLELSEAEKASRAKVLLPYEHRGDGREVKIYDGRPTASAAQTKSKRDGRIGYETSGEAHPFEAIGKEASWGHILYERDSDEEPPDSDEDPDDDLDI